MPRRNYNMRTVLQHKGYRDWEVQYWSVVGYPDGIKGPSDKITHRVDPMGALWSLGSHGIYNYSPVNSHLELWKWLHAFSSPK
jgi:hypothetical protein